MAWSMPSRESGNMRLSMIRRTISIDCVVPQWPSGWGLSHTASRSDREAGRAKPDPALVPILHRPARHDDFIRRNRSVARRRRRDSRQGRCGSRPMSASSGVSAAVLLPHPLVQAVMKIEVLEVLEFRARREKSSSAFSIGQSIEPPTSRNRRTLTALRRSGRSFTSR